MTKYLRHKTSKLIHLWNPLLADADFMEIVDMDNPKIAKKASKVTLDDKNNFDMEETSISNVKVSKVKDDNQ